MYETPEDMRQLQQLLDDSYGQAGSHLRAVITPDRRLSAAGIVAELSGKRVMALATTTATGQPRVGPVDAVFYRGQLHFGSGARSARFRHLRARPSVSATVFDNERMQVTVHGNALELDPRDDPQLEACLVELYGSPAWTSWMRDIPWARIDPEKMLAFINEPKSG